MVILARLTSLVRRSPSPLAQPDLRVMARQLSRPLTEGCPRIASTGPSSGSRLQVPIFAAVVVSVVACQ